MDIWSCLEVTLIMFGNIAEETAWHMFTGHVVRTGLGRSVMCCAVNLTLWNVYCILMKNIQIFTSIDSTTWLWHQLPKNMRNNSEVCKHRGGKCLYPCTRQTEEKRWVLKPKTKPHIQQTFDKEVICLRRWLVVLPPVFVEWLNQYFTSRLFKSLILKMVHHIVRSLWLDCSEWAACLKCVL
jgi:hypothetical protein